MNNAKQILKQIQQLPLHPQCLEEREHFLSLIHQYIQASGDSDVFAKIVDYRAFEIRELANDDDNTDNLKHTFTCSTAKYLISHSSLPTFPVHYSHIECLANVYFDHILDCWAEYLVFSIHYRAKNMDEAVAEYNESIVDSDDHYHSEVVDDISLDERRFLTCFSNQLLSLSDANVLINIETFIKREGWYEMLYDMEISARGEHFILYQKVAETMLICSSVNIRRWGNKQTWLAFSPFFQSAKWSMKLDENKLRSLEFFGLLGSGSSNDLSMDSIDKFDRSLIQSISNQDAMCEVIRLAIAAPARKLNQLLFEMTKALMIALDQLGFQAVYIITEQPAIRYFFESVNNAYADVSPYVSVCEFKVSEYAPVTEQGIYFSHPMSQAISQCDYKGYYQRVLSVRKQMKLNTRNMLADE
ncbi:acyl-homoserine-lactone synthase [Vibrio hippocampi]|uniref:acyl-homoserine-lactone synthase n=1 Tax=Vibrio hippocampi TaxID=654686 RepID=A0ABN8DH76_9VIBR|nr:acyl-homoserine-lactone synthase [Vibrio hippocampi]CAH0527009.1 Acyl-homoserine-lactone synthase VanM [Vibrio hippocampi]